MSKLLVVDDERSFGEFVAKVASTVGFDVVIADSAEDCRQLVEAHSPSVIVVDLNMPGVDGIELLREMRGYYAGAEVVLASGLDARTLDMTRRLGEKLGLRIAGTLQKPVRAADLQALLKGLHRSTDLMSPESLKDAIESDRLFLAFQPKVDIRTRHMAAVEALVRCRDESGRVIFPDAFIPLAEKYDLMGPLTSWVAAHALDQAGQWHAQGLPLGIALNVSAANMRDRSLPDVLAERCQAAGVPAESVTLELTETASAQDSTMLMEILGRFRIKGFNLSIDDFGTGYSSIAQLVRLPFSELKVDKSFVMAMDRETESAIVAKAVVDLGHNLGLKVTAEGVETEASLNMLDGYGCDVAQGYLFSKPISADEIVAFAARAAPAG